MASVVDGNGGSRLVVTKLGHIKELVRQLEVHLGGSSPDLCKRLASQISSITERSISLLITTSSLRGARKRPAAAPSPLSDASDAPFIKPTKKRKTMNKKRHEVRVSSAGGGGDHPADDGHSWRKYGQKEILGAKHPRGYYRCTHRVSQGCAATKQVQRADEDPTFFDVVYLGDHTCVQSQRAAAAGQAAAEAQAPEFKCNANPGGSSLLQSLTVKTQGPAVDPEQQQQLLQGWDAPAAPFCSSASTPAATASGCLVPERSAFSAPSTSENWGASSPATSDSNHVVGSFPPSEVAALYRSSSCGDDMQVQFGMEEVLLAFDTPDGSLDDDIEIDVSSFLA